MTYWDLVLLAVGVYVAVLTLVQLMRVRRDRLLARLRSDFAAEQQRRQAEELRRQKAARRRARTAAAANSEPRAA